MMTATTAASTALDCTRLQSTTAASTALDCNRLHSTTAPSKALDCNRLHSTTAPSTALDSTRLLSTTAASLALALFAGLAHADYTTSEIASHEAQAEYISFESREWAEEAYAAATNDASVVVEGGRLQGSITWSNDATHRIFSDVYVPSGVTLTISAGAVVEFCEGTRIKVEDGGSIVLAGESGNEVVMRGVDDATAFYGVQLQSSAAGYSDNCYVIASGWTFGKFAAITINNTTAFMGGGQALVPVGVSGSRDTAFSFDWVAETNGVEFASGTMNWSKVGDGTKNITVPYPDGLPGCTNFTVYATTLRCCSASKGAAVVTLSEYITSEIATHEAMADYISFECRDWVTNVLEAASTNEAVAVEGGRLQGSETWASNATHLVTSDVYVPSGVTLTISAGAVVEFCEGTRIKVEDGGAIALVGELGNEVVLRGFEGTTAFYGVQLQSSAASYSDNCYVTASGWTFGKFAAFTINDATAFTSDSQVFVPVGVSGSRETAFSFDWVAETNGVEFASGTMNWSKVGDGTKNLTVPYSDGLPGCTNFTVYATTLRCCSASKGTAVVTLSEYITSEIATHEAMADYISFECRDWVTDVLEAASTNEAVAVEGGRLQSSTTWASNATHLVTSDVYVPSGVTLTISAGAVVEFCEGTRIKIEDGGALKVVGANGTDVVFRGYAGTTAFNGIQLQSSAATFTDNMYVQFLDRPYSAYPYITMHEATTYREAGVLYVPVTISGTTRSQAFNIDWQTDKGDAGTLTWNSSSDGTKWIQIPVEADKAGGTTNHTISITAARGCNIAVGNSTLTILEPDYSVTGQVVLAESETDSGDFSVNGTIQTQPLFLNDTEVVQYSGKWQKYDEEDAASLRVTLETDNGSNLLLETTPDKTGEFEFDWKAYPVGYYTLKHEIQNALGETLATMSKTFSIADDEDVELHGGTLAQNETWAADKVHVVYEMVYVPSVYTLFIEPGAIVKFLSGTGITIETGGALFANKIIFTHINDDTIGGDTLSDGYTVAPPMDAYTLSGNFTFGDDTELRGITQSSALTGTISAAQTLSRGSTYRVSGTLTISSGGTLTIPPGTVLKMEAGASIVVNSGGVLNAIGTRAAPIIFTSIKDDSYSGDTNGDGDATYPQPGDWVKIGVAGGKADFDFVKILYSSKNSTTGAINMTGGAVSFANGEIAHCAYDAVGVESGTCCITNSVIRDSLLAFRHWTKDPIVNCVIYDCGRLTQGGGQHFYNCIFSQITETWEAFGFPQNGTTYNNCCFWNEDGSVLTAEGTQDALTVCGSNGNIWGDPLFVDAENGDFRIVEGSPCVDAADPDIAPEYDYYGQPRITITDQGTNTVGQLPDIGICEVMPRDVASDIDLVPQSVRTVTNAVPGQLLFVKWEIANLGGAEVDASWRDTISLVSESGREVELGEKTTTSRIGVGGSVFCSGYFTVPAISEGAWYPKVNVNSYHDIFEGSLAANNALTGDRAVMVELEALDPDVARDGVVNSGVPTVLKLSFDEDDANRMVNFVLPAGAGVAWGFGFVPQVASKSGSGEGSVTFRVPDGDVEVYVVIESDSTSTYSLTTESAEIKITGVTPSVLPSSGTTTITITGAGFDEECEVSLTNASGGIQLQSTVVDANTLIATVDCATLAAGSSYTLRVAAPAATTELPDAISTTTAEGKGILELEYDVPSSVRPGRIFTFAITYRNIGNMDMCVPLLTLSDPAGDANPIMFSLDGEIFTSGGFQFMGMDTNGGFGPIHPGDEVTLRITAKIPPSNKGATAVYVRANTDSDLLAKYTTEIDRYLTPLARLEYVTATNEDIKAQGETLAGIFGANNGEMVRNFASLAQTFYENNGFALQKIHDLIPYGVAKAEGASAEEASQDMTTEETSQKSALLSASLKIEDLDDATGVWILQGYGSQRRMLTSEDDLSGKKIALIAHGWRNSVHDVWVTQMALALCRYYDVVLGVNWKKEADTWINNPRGASEYINTIAVKAAGQLNDSHANLANAVFVGHSFGSHLAAKIAANSNTRLYRHIGLDTAEDWGIPDDCEIKGNEADYMEFYRSSRIAGFDEPYVHCGYNYIVLGDNDFDSMALLEKHSYSHQWFIDNINSDSSSGLGFWSDCGRPANPANLPSSGFAGVIYGPQSKLECVYKYGVEGFNYPGNKATWESMYRAWQNAVDIATTSSTPQNENRIEANKKFAVKANLGDNADIKTVRRVYDRRISVSFTPKEGEAIYLGEKIQRAESFDINVSIPESVIPDGQDEIDGTLTIYGDAGYEDTVIAGLAGTSSFSSWNAKNELYAPDNAVETQITVYRSDVPTAVVDGCDQDEFVITETITYASEEEYESAVEAGQTFTHTFDGSGSRPGRRRKIISYSWGTSNSTKSYSATASACYPVSLTVVNDANKSDTVSGMFVVIVQIGDDGEEIEQPTSRDPNEMVGPVGEGDAETQRYVRPGEWLTYTVYFENQTNATAAAQEVYVTNPLSEYLDWSTFEMGEVAFNNQIDLGLVGESAGVSEAVMTGTNFLVRTSVQCDAGNGVVSWYMRIVDPTTETGWPEDVLAGFLPPNDDTYCGEGHLTYRVKLRDDAPAGVVITNSASIMFDYNEAIETDPAWWNTVAEIASVEFAGDCVESSSQELIVGMAYGTLPEPAERVGYTFGGWWTGAGGTGSRIIPGETIVESGGTKLYAKWLANGYSVEYHAGEADGEEYSQAFEFDVPDELDPVAFEYAHHDFAGWATNDVSAEVVYEDGAVVTNLTAVDHGVVPLYALWTLKEYTIAFDANGGSGTPASRVVTALSEVGELPVVEREGYVFSGWWTSRGAGAMYRPTTPATADATLYAHWTANKYTITFDSNGGSAVASITQDYGTKVTAPANPTRTGYTFAGWDKTIPSTMPAANMTITAKWTANKYTITFNSNGGSAVASITQNYGTKVTAPANPTRTGYTFAGWDKTIPATMPAANMTITAKWKINRHQISFDLAGGAGAADAVTLDYGSAYGELPVPTRTGYTFVGWVNAAGELVTTGTVIGDADVALTAKWSVNKYTITFNSNGGSAVAAITQDYGTKVTAPANPTRTGYTFAGWDKTIPSTMPAVDMTITAKWTVNRYTVTFDANGGEGGWSATLDYGTKITTPVVTRKGYVFAGWSAATAATVTGNATYLATWIKALNEIAPEDDGVFDAGAAAVYDGYMRDTNDSFAGTVTVKLGKKAKNNTAKVAATIVEKGKKKVAVKGSAEFADDGGTLGGSWKAADGRVLTLAFGERGLTGSFGSHTIDGARNLFTSKAAADKQEANALLAKLQGVYTISGGDGMLYSVSIGAKGKTKVTGIVVETAKKDSAAAQLITSGDAACVPVVMKKSGNAFILWIVEGEAGIEGLDDAAVGAPRTLGSGKAFHIDLGSPLLSAYIEAVLPEGVSVTQNGAKWVVPKAGKVAYKKGTTEIDEAKAGANPAALKLTYTAKTGLFKGSFKLWSEVKGKPKAVSATVNGVLIDGIGYGAAFIKKIGSLDVWVK